jgi:hypothetical protein
VSLAEISTALWRERNLLEMLLFKIEEEQLLLASGKTRWLAPATREVEAVLEEIKHTELLRASLVEAEASSLSLPSNPSLRALAAAAPPPWDDLFEEHRKAFLELTDEISAQAAANKQLLARGANAAKDLLARASRERTAGGRPNVPGEGSFLVDQAL